MKYTEEDIRKVFQAGMDKGSHQSYFDAPLDENEYIETLKQAKNNEVFVLVSKSFYSDDAIARLKTECFEKGLKANK